MKSPASEFSTMQASAALAQNLDLHMRTRLAASLDYIFESTEADFCPEASQRENLLQSIRTDRIPPVTFCLYSELVQAIEDNDFTTARALRDSLLELSFPAGPLSIVDFCTPESDLRSRHYLRYIDTDPANPFTLCPPSPEKSAACRQTIQRTLELLHDADPDLHAELHALLREVVLAVGPNDGSSMTFDGASSFMMWGAIVINADRGDSLLDMVQMLAHESAHNLLFGLFSEELPLSNGFSESHSSPLRKDARPLDGIYHATFVTARMYRAVHTLAHNEATPSDLRTAALAELSSLRELFDQGHLTLRKHGKFLPRGQQVMDEAADYIAQRL
jgi:hypothetical protein